MWNNNQGAPPSYLGGMSPQPSGGFDACSMGLGAPSSPGPMGAPSNYMGGPPMNTGAPSYMGGPGNMGAPPMNSGYMGGPPPPMNSGYMGGPPPGNMGAPPMNSGYMGGPPMNSGYMGGPPPGNMGAPNYMGGPPPGNMGAPPMNSGYMGGPPMNGGHMGTQGSPQGTPVAARAGNAHIIQSGGKRRALVIGINYLQCQRGRLAGCINDAHNISQFMAQHFGFRDIRLLTDDTPTNSQNHPTKQNMIAGMHWLVSDAKPGDSFFFHFSGHGGQSEDKTHMEEDGLNETICPADYQQAGMIVDDDLHDILVRHLPEGCRFTAIFDSCHSGTALDLPYIYKVTSGQFKNAHKAEEDRFWGRHKAKMKDKKSSGITGLLSSHVGGEISHQVKKKVRRQVMQSKNTTKAIVVMFSGCRDDQTSADTTMANQATGAMSYSFMETLKKNVGTISYADLVDGMRNVLHNGAKQFTQLPQLSYGRPMDMSQPFTM